jgi:hypothetical protein
MGVPLLSAAWQAQPHASVRTCPNCGGLVHATFNATRYAAWFAVLLGAAAAAGFLGGADAFSALLVAAFVVPFVPSIHLVAAS